MTALRLTDVSHAFDGNPVVRRLSLVAESGALTCLLGPSGCGKTTVLRLAAGLEALQLGVITIGERIVADANDGRQVPPEQRGVGLMFQDYALFPHLTVIENITFGLTEKSPARLDWVRGALERMGIEDRADSYPHTLSGGEQQRVALLRALAPRPQVLLLDEPFSGLDVTLRAQVREQTLGLLQETGVTTLMVTHDPEEAMFMADRILVMRDGRIVQAGKPRETYFRPLDAFVAALFGPINRLNGVVQGGRVETPLGWFDAPDLADGTPAQILIRPEGLALSRVDADAPSANTMLVVSARLIGRSSHLRLCRGAGTAENIHLHARVPGTFLPDSGTPVVVRVDHERAYVFPAG
jgi:iron(III) transport system ATP-binding protein